MGQFKIYFLFFLIMFLNPWANAQGSRCVDAPLNSQRVSTNESLKQLLLEALTRPDKSVEKKKIDKALSSPSIQSEMREKLSQRFMIEEIGEVQIQNFVETLVIISELMKQGALNYSELPKALMHYRVSEFINSYQGMEKNYFYFRGLNLSFEDYQTALYVTSVSTVLFGKDRTRNLNFLKSYPKFPQLAIKYLEAHGGQKVYGASPIEAVDKLLDPHQGQGFVVVDPKHFHDKFLSFSRFFRKGKSFELIIDHPLVSRRRSQGVPTLTNTNISGPEMVDFFVNQFVKKITFDMSQTAQSNLRDYLQAKFNLLESVLGKGGDVILTRAVAFNTNQVVDEDPFAGSHIDLFSELSAATSFQSPTRIVDPLVGRVLSPVNGDGRLTALTILNGAARQFSTELGYEGDISRLLPIFHSPNSSINNSGRWAFVLFVARKKVLIKAKRSIGSLKFEIDEALEDRELN